MPSQVHSCQNPFFSFQPTRGSSRHATLQQPIWHGASIHSIHMHHPVATPLHSSIGFFTISWPMLLSQPLPNSGSPPTSVHHTSLSHVSPTVAAWHFLHSGLLVPLPIAGVKHPPIFIQPSRLAKILPTHTLSCHQLASHSIPIITRPLAPLGQSSGSLHTAQCQHFTVPTQFPVNQSFNFIFWQSFQGQHHFSGFILFLLPISTSIISTPSHHPKTHHFLSAKVKHQTSMHIHSPIQAGFVVGISSFIIFPIFIPNH